MTLTLVVVCIMKSFVNVYTRVITIIVRRRNTF